MKVFRKALSAFPDAMSSEFIHYLEEVFADFGPIRARRMFGGYGLYHEDLMFALVADDTLYLKADEQNMPSFIERGLPAFQYSRGDKLIQMSYYQAPEEILEDPIEAAVWARQSLAAAHRSKR